MPQIRLDNPDLPLADLMARWPQTVPVFLRHGTSCVGCLISRFHTIEDVCAEYGFAEAQFMAELRAAIAAGA